MTTVWRGYITFALISIPVQLFRAARPERVKLRQLYRIAPEQPGPALAPPARRSAHREESPEPVEELVVPVRQAAMQQTGDQVIPRSALTKGYEYEKDRYVTIDQEELKSVAPKTSAEMDIQEFVKLEQIDPIYFETSYYIRPEEAGEKAYALLYETLRETGLVAIARFAMHGREHMVVLRTGRSGIIGHTMYFSSEIRADLEYKTDTTLVSKKELDLAKTLVNNLVADFEPEKYHDTYREKVEGLIAAKLEGKQTAAAKEMRRPAAVTDITEALRKSLAAIKKPAKSVEGGKRRVKSGSKGG